MPLNSGSPFGAGGLSNENNGYPMTPVEGGGELSSGQSGGTANANTPQPGTSPSNTATAGPATGTTANTLSAILPFKGRWWYPMPNGNWVYWDHSTSSWVFYSGNAASSANGTDTSGAVANGTDTNGQYSSGYRGLNTPTTSSDATANPPSAANHWYWRNGQWFWFDGQTFQPAK